MSSVPQLLSNYRAYQVARPLLVDDLYGGNVILGIQSAKYGTISIAGIPSRLYYDNPFAPADGDVDPTHFVLQHPLSAVATVAVCGEPDATLMTGARTVSV